ncbi:MAG: hypothetical protein M3235_06825 [Actinomycetota bacterium]|nr:hypothetical protein [Actinomycetota bacterium]
MDGRHEATPLDPDAIPRPRGAVEPMPSVPAPRPGPSRGMVDGDRGRVLARYARLMRSGRPEVCRPGRRERTRLDPRSAVFGNDGKVIYPDRDAAERAARELEALGARPQRSYLCARSRRGHFHLTTDQAAERCRGPLPDAIPRQRGR